MYGPQPDPDLSIQGVICHLAVKTGSAGRRVIFTLKAISYEPLTFLSRLKSSVDPPLLVELFTGAHALIAQNHPETDFV